MLSSVVAIVVDNARVPTKTKEKTLIGEEPPALRWTRGLLLAKPKRSQQQKSRRSHLKKAWSLDGCIGDSGTASVDVSRQRTSRRRRRASVTLLCRVKSWEDLNGTDCFDEEPQTSLGVPDDFTGHHEQSSKDIDDSPSHSLVYRRRGSVEFNKSFARQQSFDETADRMPRRPRRSSCIGTSESVVAKPQKATYYSAVSLGDSSECSKNNDFRPIRPRRSSLAMYETKRTDTEETPWSSSKSDAIPTMPQRTRATSKIMCDSFEKREFPEDTRPEGEPPLPVAIDPPLKQGGVCFPAQA